MSDSLISEWNDLQARSPKWGETEKEVQKMNAEIRILEALRKLGEDIAPNGLPLAEMIDVRRDLLQQIERESHGG
ncbi:MAG TPA: hypothetical protein VG347_19760 [Verrucomicrobiae bacterium]|nr:hypothetical protein [Verrucomicrobiae bacterium]